MKKEEFAQLWLSMDGCTIYNREAIEESRVCVCTNCMGWVYPTMITRWVDEGETALCPYCGLDFVAPEMPGEHWTEPFVEMVNSKSKPVTLGDWMRHYNVLQALGVKDKETKRKKKRKTKTKAAAENKVKTPSRIELLFEMTNMSFNTFSDIYNSCE